MQSISQFTIFSSLALTRKSLNFRILDTIQWHLEGASEANYMQRVGKSIMRWNDAYGFSLSAECETRMDCHLLFESFQWDVVTDLNKLNAYQNDLLKMYEFIKHEALGFVGNNVTWRDAPIPAPWAFDDRRRDGDIKTLAVFNQIGFELFPKKCDKMKFLEKLPAIAGKMILK